MLVTSWTEILTSWPLFQNTFILRRSEVDIFADITKIVTMFIKTIFKDSRKVKMQSISVCLDIAKFGNFSWKMLMSTEIKECVTWFIYFLDLLQVRYNFAKFHHCRISVTGFREWCLFGPPIREQPQKSPSWIGLSANPTKGQTLKLFECV